MAKRTSIAVYGEALAEARMIEAKLKSAWRTATLSGTVDPREVKSTLDRIYTLGVECLKLARDEYVDSSGTGGRR